jgi:proline dehydrogenase
VVVYDTSNSTGKIASSSSYDSYDRAQKAGFLLGAKLVRGAYMEKEGERAAEMGYENPINESKQITDEYVQYCTPILPRSPRYNGGLQCQP